MERREDGREGREGKGGSDEAEKRTRKERRGKRKGELEEKQPFLSRGVPQYPHDASCFGCQDLTWGAENTIDR